MIFLNSSTSTGFFSSISTSLRSSRALATKPAIILADEPVSALDPVTSVEIMEELRKINETMNKTVIVNIHSVDLAKQFSKRIIALQDGKVVFDGAPDLLTNEVLTMIYKGDSFLKGSEK